MFNLKTFFHIFLLLQDHQTHFKSTFHLTLILCIIIRPHSFQNPVNLSKPTKNSPMQSTCIPLHNITINPKSVSHIECLESTRILTPSHSVHNYFPIYLSILTSQKQISKLCERLHHFIINPKSPS